MLIEARLIAAPEHCVRDALRDDRDDLLSPQFVFGAGEMLSPHHDDARWFLEQMRRCGQTRERFDAEDAVIASYRLGTHNEASGMATSVIAPLMQ